MEYKQFGGHINFAQLVFPSEERKLEETELQEPTSPCGFPVGRPITKHDQSAPVSMDLGHVTTPPSSFRDEMLIPAPAIRLTSPDPTTLPLPSIILPPASHPAPVMSFPGAHPAGMSLAAGWGHISVSHHEYESAVMPEDWLLDSADRPRDLYDSKVDSADRPRDQYDSKVDSADRPRDQYDSKVDSADRSRDHHGSKDGADRSRDHYSSKDSADRSRDHYGGRDSADRSRDHYGSKDSGVAGGVLYCPFCRKNGETKEFYTTHLLKDTKGRVICPVLRAYTCPLCRQTGDHAHTESHCPLSRGNKPIVTTLRTPLTSCGSRRHAHHNKRN